MAREDIPLDLLDQIIRWGRGKKWERVEERVKGEKREEKKRREKLLILSSFLEDPTIGVRRSMRQSSSLW